MPGARCINTKAFQAKEESGAAPAAAAAALAGKETTQGAANANIASVDWCERILLHAGSRTLFAMFKVRARAGCTRVGVSVWVCERGCARRESVFERALQKPFVGCAPQHVHHRVASRLAGAHACRTAC